jgi:hypothetical protein
MTRSLGFILPKRWPTGAEFEAHKARMRALRTVDIGASSGLYAPTILDQGDEGSCGGFAEVQCIHVLTGRPILSPAFPYWCARREAVGSDDAVTDDGIDPFDMVDAIGDFGACPQLDMPYDPSRRNAKPGPLAFQTAQRVRCKMTPILESGEDLWPVLQHVLLVEKLPVFIGIDVFPAFDNVGPDGIVDDPSGTSRGGHAQCLYDAVALGGVDANSWGRSWGKDGTAILTPRYLARACQFAASVEVLP